MNHRDHDVGCLVEFYQFLSDLANVLSVHLQSLEVPAGDLVPHVLPNSTKNGSASCRIYGS